MAISAALVYPDIHVFIRTISLDHGHSGARARHAHIQTMCSRDRYQLVEANNDFVWFATIAPAPPRHRTRSPWQPEQCRAEHKAQCPPPCSHLHPSPLTNTSAVCVCTRLIKRLAKLSLVDSLPALGSGKQLIAMHLVNGLSLSRALTSMPLSLSLSLSG